MGKLVKIRTATTALTNEDFEQIKVATKTTSIHKALTVCVEKYLEDYRIGLIQTTETDTHPE